MKGWRAEMSVHIIRADLSELPFYVDFIVNTANPEQKVGNGLDKSIYKKAGPEMLEMRKRIGQICPGDIAVTNAFNLNAKKVIHAVSVAWTDGFHDEAAIVQKCYRKSLSVAVDYMNNHQMNSVSIAMPIIGTGIYQIPLEVSLPIAMAESTQFALKYNMEIFIVILTESVVTAVKKVFPVEECVTYQEACGVFNYEYSRNQIPAPPERIHDSIKQSDYFRNKMQPKNFRELLQKHMEDRNITSSQIYDYIGLSRQSFSEIRSGKKIPRKETAILFALRLRLSLQELEEFLEKAGHALSDDKEEDRLTKEFFTLQCYDIYRYLDARAERGYSNP